MHVVVTGGAGFIGRAVLEHLRAAGAQVVSVDRRPHARPSGPTGLHVLTADLLDDRPDVTAVLRAATAVVHLAGCPGVRDDRPGIEGARQRDNVDATARVLAAVPAHVPLVIASSSSVYGGAPPGAASREDHPLCPRGGYARSKAEVERMCAERVAAGARVTVARPFTVAGEGQRQDMAISRWLAAARAGRPLRVFGSLERRRDVTDVAQVARALVELTRLGEPGPVNVGTGVGHSLADLVDAVGAALGVQPAVEVVAAADEDVPATLADTGRLRGLLGWVPRTVLPDLVRRQAGPVPVAAAVA